MKWHLPLACLLLTFASCVLACEQVEPPQPPPDYREPYVGTYRFLSHDWSHSLGVMRYSDTVVSLGTIDFAAGSDSFLEVRFRTDPPNFDCHDGFYSSCIALRLLNSSGEMSFPALDRYSHVSFYAEFFGTDSVSIEYGQGGNGAQGGYRIRGRRLD